MIVVSLLALLAWSHAQTFEADPKFNGHYEGTCAQPSRDVQPATPVSVTLDDTGLILAHPMPARRALSGEIVPGRVWQVKYPKALLSRVPGPEYCVQAKSSPRDAREMATLCFAKDEASGRNTVTIKTRGHGLFCGELTLVRGNGYSAFEGREPYAPVLGIVDRPVHEILARTVRSATELRLPSAQKSAFNLITALSKFRSPRALDQRAALEFAGQGFLAGGAAEMFERWTVLNQGLQSADPALRAMAFSQIALYAHVPLAVPSILAELRLPSDLHVLRAALGAAEGVLEPLNEYVLHQTRLNRRFGTFDLVNIFERTEGFIDAADLAAVVARETYALPGHPWSSVQRDDLLGALANVAENFGLPRDVRERAARVAVDNEVYEDELAKFFALTVHSNFSSDRDKVSAAALFRQLDYNRANFIKLMIKTARAQTEAPGVRAHARRLLGLRHRPRKNPIFARCQRALADLG